MLKSTSAADYRAVLAPVLRRLAPDAPDAPAWDVDAVADALHDENAKTGMRTKAFMTVLRHALSAMKVRTPSLPPARGPAALAHPSALLSAPERAKRPGDNVHAGSREDGRAAQRGGGAVRIVVRRSRACQCQCQCQCQCCGLAWRLSSRFLLMLVDDVFVS